jgi:type IV pilus assembly protein PilV
MLQPSGIVRKKPWLLSDDSGISFIDLMLSLVVLTIGVLALMDLQVIATRSNSSSSGTVIAISLAEEKIETFKNTAFQSIVSQPSTTWTDPVTKIIYTTTATVTNNQPISGVKKVDVTVTWSDKAGAHKIPMATVIAPQ